MRKRAGPDDAAANMADLRHKRRLAFVVCRKGVWTELLEAVKVSIHIRKAALLQLAEGGKSRVVSRVTEVEVDASMGRRRDFHIELTTLALSKRASDDGLLADHEAQALPKVVENLLDIGAAADREELSDGVMDSRA